RWGVRVAGRRCAPRVWSASLALPAAHLGRVGGGVRVAGRRCAPQVWSASLALPAAHPGSASWRDGVA
ncbi:MAG: hypothetical protein MUE36_15085, partial [Acidimicrobiales bacterium]|nr:hypothetical protein [Acidimicrobiales bacterium]